MIIDPLSSLPTNIRNEAYTKCFIDHIHAYEVNEYILDKYLSEFTSPEQINCLMYSYNILEVIKSNLSKNNYNSLKTVNQYELELIYPYLVENNIEYNLIINYLNRNFILYLKKDNKKIENEIMYFLSYEYNPKILGWNSVEVTEFKTLVDEALLPNTNKINFDLIEKIILNWINETRLKWQVTYHNKMVYFKYTKDLVNFTLRFK